MTRWTKTQLAAHVGAPALVPRKLYASKAEERYAAILQSQQRAGQIRGWRYEGLTLKLADGVRYTPDFLVVENDGAMTLLEVKGFMREAARLRLRIAVEMYPAFRWFLIWAKKGGFDPQKLA